LLEIGRRFLIAILIGLENSARRSNGTVSLRTAKLDSKLAGIGRSQIARSSERANDVFINVKRASPANDARGHTEMTHAERGISNHF